MLAGIFILGAFIIVLVLIARGSGKRNRQAGSRLRSDGAPLSSGDLYTPLFLHSLGGTDAASPQASSRPAQDCNSSSASGHDATSSPSSDSSCGCDGGGSGGDGGGGGGGD